FVTCRSQAALYRLTGDRHPIHVDTEVARRNGFERPILHGLCTLGIAARLSAGAVGAHPADLQHLQTRFAAPVMPGDRIELSGCGDAYGLAFEATVNDTVVLKGGRAAFASSAGDTYGE
ncbi:MAG: MaoC/PaaZ C-terminal domain-containing protein, partial [Gammaproteobacteria bacterium]